MCDDRIIGRIHVCAEEGWSEEISPGLDVVVLCFHAVNPSLDRVAVVVDDEDGEGEFVADDVADCLDGHLEGAVADEEDGSLTEGLLGGSACWWICGYDGAAVSVDGGGGVLAD